MSTLVAFEKWIRSGQKFLFPALFLALGLFANQGAIAANHEMMVAANEEDIDTTAADSALEEELAEKRPGARVVGVLELRPGVYFNENNALRTENMAEAGYQFSKKFSLIYRQEFNTNIADNTLQGLSVTTGNGLLRAPINNILVDEKNGLSFSYEPRVYLPVNYGLKGTGYIGSLRNYFKFKKNLTSNIDVTLMEIPIFHTYNTAGQFNTFTGKTEVYPGFENRVYLIFDFRLLNDKLAISVPFNWNTVFYRNYTLAGAKSGSNDNILWMNPEVTYSVADHVDLGVAYQTADISETDGLSNGFFQLVLRTTL